MFWTKDKTIRVELVSPPIVLPAAASASLTNSGGGNAADSFMITLDQFLKIAAVMVAVVNTALVVLGYMRYVGMLQQFGVSRTEVSFSLSDMLSFGYIGFLNMTLSGQVAVSAVCSIITLPVMVIVIRLKRNMHSLPQFLLVWVISTIFFFVITGPYWVAYNPGKQAALKLAAKSLGIEESHLLGLEVEQQVSTDSGFMTGNIVLATPDLTFLLRDAWLYKIRASDGKILRKTSLQPKLGPIDGGK